MSLTYSHTSTPILDRRARLPPQVKAPEWEAVNSLPSQVLVSVGQGWFNGPGWLMELIQEQCPNVRHPLLHRVKARHMGSEGQCSVRGPSSGTDAVGGGGVGGVGGGVGEDEGMATAGRVGGGVEGGVDRDRHSVPFLVSIVPVRKGAGAGEDGSNT